MNNTIKERVRTFCAYKQITVSKFEKECGLSNAYIASMRKGFGIDKLNNILKRFPELNRDWLLYGDGKMLNDIYNDNEDEIRGDVISVPFVGREITTSPEYNVKKMVQTNSPMLELFPLEKMIKGINYIQTVVTMAMAPRFMPGDYLFVAFREGQIISGKTYLVDTRTYGTMFRHVYIDKNGYILRASNPEFKDVFVKNEDVYSISSVPISVNTNTSLTSDINLAELVKKRDKNIEMLMSQNNEMLSELREQSKRNNKLIERQNELTDFILNNLSRDNK